MKILVTGATGFLGCHFMDELCRRVDGFQIRVLSLFDTPALQAHGVEVLIGTVTSPVDVARAMEDVTHVYHLAGLVSRKPEDANLMFDVHVNGTRVVCQEAAKAGVKRILMSSTSGTIAISERDDEWPDESSPAPLSLITRWGYYASKYYQEAVAREFCGDKVELVMVNPSLLLGPGDERIGSTREVLSFLAGDVRVVPGGGLNFVDARDVAAILPVAMDRGRAGERYLLGGHNMSFAEYFDRMERLSKEYAPRIKLPGNWPHFAARAQAALFKAIGRTPPIEPAAADQARYFWYFDGKKARGELGFAPREASATLWDTIAYVRAHHMGNGAFAKKGD
ncbi:MAG: NAD-dependent epimerase/dehydratase family protein [Deltaproteobacteria bacterium]|nr:NAD-dependent epimerase/dehydratase family protein [Deltaproteobacteria bacterium]